MEPSAAVKYWEPVGYHCSTFSFSWDPDKVLKIISNTLYRNMPDTVPCAAVRQHSFRKKDGIEASPTIFEKISRSTKPERLVFHMTKLDIGQIPL